MYSFKNDYSEGAHPQILQALLDSNMEQVLLRQKGKIRFVSKFQFYKIQKVP